MLRCADNSLYTGICVDIEKRIEQHNHDDKRAAKYTRNRRPVELAYLEHQADRSHASKKEYLLKQLSKMQKERLCAEFAQAKQLNNKLV